MRTAIFAVCVALLLNGRGATAAVAPEGQPVPEGARQKVERICKAQPLGPAAVGVLAVRMDGDTVACVNPGLRLVPASNMKLITTGLALLELGEDYRFETRLAYSGSIEDGVLHGDLYIVGGGDPTTGARVPCAEPLESLFSEWAGFVRDAGITRIEGRVVADPRYFPEPVAENFGWTYDDLGTNYGAGPTGLNFFENAQNFLVRPASSAGSAPSVRVSYPETPWMEYRNYAVTSSRGTANTLCYINTPLAPVASFVGEFPSDRGAYTLECSNSFAAYTCASYFCRYLESRGIRSLGPADIGPDGGVRLLPGETSGPAAASWGSLTFIGSSYSPTLASIVRETNCESDNFFAETLFKALSLSRSGSAGYGDCCAAAEAALLEAGLPAEGVCQIFDGSGLSRKNYVSADFFVRFLRMMLQSPCADIYLRTLPSPGERGTLEYKFPSETPEFRSRIRMKSGSMNGVRSYSGYILASDGDPSHTIVFSLITNNLTASSWAVNPVLDSIIRAIAAEN